MADAGGLFGLLSIFKNEAHIMAEWVDHYVAEGVDKFYLIDNGSTDDYMPILTPHIVSGLVVLVKDAKRHAQVEHYNKHFHATITRECAWVMTVDFDEFLYARKPHATTKAYLATLPAAIHQVRVPWKMFGTGGSTTDGLRGRRIGDSDRSGDSDRRRAGDSDRRGARIVAQARLVCLSDHGRARGSV